MNWTYRQLIDQLQAAIEERTLVEAKAAAQSIHERGVK